ncbi:MAG: YqgE/AlgH family protein [Gammaproteobacteria bacterium]
MSEVSINALAGQLLLAMPSLNDPNFSKSVILVCEHNTDGALGLVVNRHLPLKLGEVLRNLDLSTEHTTLNADPVYAGGPVEEERGFVLHDAPGAYADSLTVNAALAVSASEAVLAAIARGEGPGRFLVALGYAGWGPGQLEQEFADNAWLAVPASPELIFDPAVEERWQRAADVIGLDLSRISHEAGHA